jgi:peroxiredoxin
MVLNFRFYVAGGLALCLGLTAALAQAQAQPIGPNTPPLVLQGTTLADTRFELSKLKGKVVMVFYWSTRCSVCLSHMAELRANLGGWRGKPFELVTVNVDSSMADWRAYEQITAKVEAVRPLAIWSGKPPTQKLPLTLVVDTQGRVVARHEGRIAPEAWDAVAEIIP